MKNRVLLSLGSNVGDSIQNLTNTITEIDKNNLLKNITKSDIYKTEPFGYENQNWFYNMCIFGETELNAIDLFHSLKKIELKIGRINRGRWKEREIDIDIIYYNQDIINLDFLKIPHPEMQKRRFVLVPASELNMDIIHPFLYKTIFQLILDCNDKSALIKI